MTGHTNEAKRNDGEINGVTTNSAQNTYSLTDAVRHPSTGVEGLAVFQSCEPRFPRRMEGQVDMHCRGSHAGFLAGAAGFFLDTVTLLSLGQVCRSLDGGRGGFGH